MSRLGRSGMSAFGRTAIAFVAVGSLLAGTLTATPARAKPEPSVPSPSPGPSVKGVKPLPTRFVTPPNAAKDSYRPTRTVWPKAAASRLDLAAASARAATPAKVRAVGTPVWAQPVPRDNSDQGPGLVEVRVADRAAAEAAGVDGVLLSLRPEAAQAAGVVRVGVDYAGFAEAFGGNFGSRLGLVRLPACALTTPQVAACRTGSPLVSSNDLSTQSVSAQVPLPAGGPRPAADATVVLAAVADAGDEGGEGGTYAATDLKPSGSWTGGGSTGSFTYSYPVSVPPAASDLAPTVELSYDSASVDGQTASTNAQASWVGDGWSTGRSFIEQTFASCQDDPGGEPSPVKTYDRCWDGPVLTMSLNGSSTALVWDAGKEIWKPEQDNGEVITRVTNSNNGSGTYNTDYWRVTLRDGTVYEFGRNRLPGWTSGKPETKSVDHTPVYSPHAGDPCYDSAGFSASVCTMAYRWSLDHVVDVHGNAMAYYYGQDTNFYGRNKGATDVSYIRDSWLSRIDYGFRDGGAYGTVPNRVVFHTGDRCLSGTCQPLNAANKANWPDVPFDLICASGTDCDNWSPSFFSTVRLTSIETQQWNTGTSQHEKIDSYALTHTMPATGDGTSPTLWLSSITRTGHDLSAGGTAAITLPSVSFSGIKLANRVDTAGGLPSFYRQRISAITTETGSVIAPSYELPVPCTAPVTQSPASNTKSCYPSYWTPDGYVDPHRDWFHKYAVTRVTSTDPTGGAPALTTSYKYLDGAAWRYDENEVVKAKYRTYGQFRGYGKVQTFTGDGVNDRRTMSQATYYRGMSKNNSTTVVNVTDSAGGVHEDVDEFAGRVLETTEYLGENGRIDSSTITSYWASGATAIRTRSGLSALTARWVQPVKTYTRKAVTSGATPTWRYTATEHSYDANTASATLGALKHTYTYTVPTNPTFDQCTSYTYAPANTGKNLVGLPSQVETVAVACGGFTAGSPPSEPGSVNTLTAPASVSRPAQVVKAERIFYDDTTFAVTFPQASAPTKGNVTMTRTATDHTADGYVWQTTARGTFDSYGRSVDSFDANGNKSTLGYTMNAVGLTTGASSTNALQQTSTTTVNPRRGSTLTSTDPNSVVTRQQYDAVGRATSVWLHSRATTSLANHTFSYTVSKTSVTAVTSRSLLSSNGYLTSVTLYDAMLRERQTQADTPNGGRMITDTFYDTRGWTRATYNGWWDTGSLPIVSNPVSAADLGRQVPNQTFTTYDGLGRAVVVEAKKDGVTISSTTTVYHGDRTTVVPPDGGTVATTVTDPLDRKTQLVEYTSRPTVTAPPDTFTGTYTVTGGTTTTSSYGYDARGNQSTVTDAAGNVWTSTYNLLGQVVSKSDPDAGTGTMSYDANDNLQQTTDARGKTLSFTYDALNRKTGEYAATLTNQAPANQRAKWVYDNSNNVAGVTNPIGQLTTTTAYRDGHAYTTQQKAFNVFGNSLGATITIPDAEGALAGSYVYGHTYDTVLGLPLTDSYPVKGSLPAETVGHGYNQYDLPVSLAGLAGYTQDVTYDAWGRVNQQKIGTATNFALVTNTYDTHTSRLTNQLVSKATSGTTATPLDEQEYRYDLYGKINRKTSKRNGASTPAETQCYGYDGLNRLTEAWTATDNCTTAPTPGNRTMVGNNIGQGSAYWTSWEIDAIGNRTKQTERNLTSGNDTTTTYTHDGNGQNKPHTLTATNTTGAATGTGAYTYDNAGNMTGRNATEGNQTLTWDDAGKLVTVTGGTSGTNTFTYDADGNLLLQKEPGKTTLYLPGQQLTLNTTTGTIEGDRYHALPGGGTCIRSGTGTNYTFAIADHQGTPTLYLNNTAQTPTWRQYTPYGAPRGTTATYPDNRGFLNKPMSPTGLTTIGARAYDPVIGRFISVDPVMDLTEPQQWHGYSYANNNPSTLSDPDGQRPLATNGGYEEDRYWSSGGGKGTKLAKNPKTKKWGVAKKKPSAPKPPPKKKPAIILGDKQIGAPDRKALEDAINKWSIDGAGLGLGDKEYYVGFRICQEHADWCSQWALENAEWVGQIDGLGYYEHRMASDPFFSLFESLQSAPAGGKGRGRSRPGGSCFRSFAADTQVLMADGSTKRIEDIKVGDLVLATDPETRKHGPREVTHVWVHGDQLVDLKMANDTKITTTEDHPFWNHTDQQWQDAQHLDRGDLLLTATGGSVPVVGLLDTTETWGAAYNLTVDDIHTYYVIAGKTPVLVHNDDPWIYVTGPNGERLGVARASQIPGSPLDWGYGRSYDVAEGTPGLHKNVKSVRVMDPSPRNSDGYVVYRNAAGQTVNPVTGRTTVGKADPYAHISGKTLGTSSC
ncbi:polymorphic toxin-type HINT domain-containing protein [Plantactinospora sp. CA-294935]|uniref:polymorphic toxin-type HINT domain-containing protein n=1 Tax=Plantactinospora sp. CA-294935 TaxID=3240012 RepID=UPI003D8F5C5F